MASQILPVWCSWKIALADGREVACNKRGNKNFGGLCPKHRVEAHEAAEAERKGR